jgi:hypothetical protein
MPLRHMLLRKMPHAIYYIVTCVITVDVTLHVPDCRYIATWLRYIHVSLRCATCHMPHATCHMPTLITPHAYAATSYVTLRRHDADMP